MEYYEKIKELRIAKGITQQKMAELTGYNDRSSIAKIESGLVDIPQSKLETFASVLGCAPAYLMGWSKGCVEYDEGEKLFDSNHIELIHLYEELNADGQTKLLDYASDLVASGRYIKSDTVSKEA